MIKLVALMHIQVIEGYTILGYNKDGSPKTKMHTVEIPYGEVFEQPLSRAEVLIREGHARIYDGKVTELNAPQIAD